MLKIKRKKFISELNDYNSNEIGIQKKSNILKWIEEEMQSFSYNLTDENSDFFVNNLLREQNKLIVVEMYIKPKRGIFQGIEFRPKMYISCQDLVKRPKIYNDRRIFHPNINIQTLEVIYPEVVLDWNPTKKLEGLLKSLKYILIEPNVSFIPNTELNKKAGMSYHFRRGQYRQIIFENMPLSFESLFGNSQINKDSKSDLMELQSQSSQKNTCEWFDIRSLYPAKIFGPKVTKLEQNNTPAILKRPLIHAEWKDQEQIRILAKQMKKVHVVSDTQIEPLIQME